MKARSLVLPDIAVRPAPGARPAARGPAESLSFAGWLFVWALLAVILASALFLRLYRLDGSFTFYPDTYGQLRAAERLVSADFPISYHYPPGVAVFLAPFFAFLPHTLLTMQMAIMAAGIALILVAYVATAGATGDRRAALFFAAAVAIGATFVFHSRLALFDLINTLLIALSLFLAPVVARRGFAALVPYGILVFAAVTVRYTNLVLLPALFIASLGVGSRPLSLRVAVDHLRSRAVVTVGLVVLVLYAGFLATSSENVTRFANPGYGSVIGVSGYPLRLGQYLRASLVGYGGEFRWGEVAPMTALLALAVVGAHRLWPTNRSLLVSIAYLLIVWSPVHAFYIVFCSRYTMPVFFLLLMLAAVGLSTSLDWLRGLRQPWQRVGLAALLTLAVTLFAGGQLAQDLTFLRHWPQQVIKNRENAYDDIRAVLRTLDGPSSVLVSSQALAVDQANPAIATYDLVRHSGSYGINDDSIDRLLSYVRTQQANGKTVYYHYTEYEDEGSDLHRYELGFDAYFAALQREFSLRELVRATERPHRLYLLEPSSPAD